MPARPRPAAAPKAGAARFLIITADDFGLHESVNEAVERSARAGVLTAASLMVAAPAAADAVRRARALPALRVGLHLVLADGLAALAPERIPDLVDAGGRFGERMAADGLRFFASPRVRRQLRAEIRAQFAAFSRSGLALDHVNAHKHFHLHPTVLDLMLEIGREFGLRAVRLPAEPLRLGAPGHHRHASWARFAGNALLSPWLARMRRQLRAAGIAHNDHVFGIAASGSMDESALLGILSRLPEGVTEIYLHPATTSGAAIARSMHRYRHADELAALLSPRVRAALADCGALAGGFADLPVTHAAPLPA